MRRAHDRDWHADASIIDRSLLGWEGHSRRLDRRFLWLEDRDVTTTARRDSQPMKEAHSSILRVSSYI